MLASALASWDDLPSDCAEKADGKVPNHSFGMRGQGLRLILASGHLPTVPTDASHLQKSCVNIVKWSAMPSQVDNTLGLYRQ